MKTGENKDLKWTMLVLDVYLDVYFLFTLQILTTIKLIPDLIWNLANDRLSCLEDVPVVNFQILTFACSKHVYKKKVVFL